MGHWIARCDGVFSLGRLDSVACFAACCFGVSACGWGRRGGCEGVWVARSVRFSCCSSGVRGCCWGGLFRVCWCGDVGSRICCSWFMRFFGGACVVGSFGFGLRRLADGCLFVSTICWGWVAWRFLLWVGGGSVWAGWHPMCGQGMGGMLERSGCGRFGPAIGYGLLRWRLCLALHAVGGFGGGVVVSGGSVVAGRCVPVPGQQAADDRCGPPFVFLKNFFFFFFFFKSPLGSLLVLGLWLLRAAGGCDWAVDDWVRNACLVRFRELGELEGLGRALQRAACGVFRAPGETGFPEHNGIGQARAFCPAITGQVAY